MPESPPVPARRRPSPDRVDPDSPAGGRGGPYGRRPRGVGCLVLHALVLMRPQGKGIQQYIPLPPPLGPLSASGSLGTVSRLRLAGRGRGGYCCRVTPTGSPRFTLGASLGVYPPRHSARSLRAPPTGGDRHLAQGEGGIPRGPGAGGGGIWTVGFMPYPYPPPDPRKPTPRIPGYGAGPPGGGEGGGP